MLGVNQCIMMSLSMVVIASLIGAAGLGSEILQALSSLDAGQGFVASFGATVTVHAMDVRVGGERRVSMTMPTPGGERVIHFAGVHLEVEQPRRLFYTEAMVDAEHAHPTGSSTEVQVVLEPSGAGTRLTLTHRGIAAGSPGETGWSMALDKLQHAAAP